MLHSPSVNLQPEKENRDNCSSNCQHGFDGCHSESMPHFPREQCGASSGVRSERPGNQVGGRFGRQRPRNPCAESHDSASSWRRCSAVSTPSAHGESGGEVRGSRRELSIDPDDHATRTGWSIEWDANRRQALRSSASRSGISSRICSVDKPAAKRSGDRQITRYSVVALGDTGRWCVEEGGFVHREGWMLETAARCHPH